MKTELETTTHYLAPLRDMVREHRQKQIERIAEALRTSRLPPGSPNAGDRYWATLSDEEIAADLYDAGVSVAPHLNVDRLAHALDVAVHDYAGLDDLAEKVAAEYDRLGAATSAAQNESEGSE